MYTVARMALKADLISAVRFYVDKIVTDPTVGGMKALIFDDLTSKIVSMVYSQTQILEQEVYLVQKIGKPQEPMRHLKAVIFVQPTESNLDLLVEELGSPKFSEYHIFFSNILPQDMLTRLARADEFELVRQVQEYYADFLAINEDLFHLGADNSLTLSSSLSRNLQSSQLMMRNVQGILSVLLSLRRRPSQIRYQATSDLARRVASELITEIERDDIFDFRRQEGPMLLILDRRDDPITPLLTQWTYQAMVHELLGLNYNRVSLKDAPGIKEDLKEVVLSCTQDNFFARNRHANFGDLGAAVKELLDDYQRSCKLNENISSIEDMQAFMERYPAFRSRSINVSKHVAIMGELARLTDKCQLLDISSLEQEISCANDHAEHKRLLFEKIASTKIQSADKLRLALVFAIRYESYDEVKEVKTRLVDAGFSNSETAILDALLEYAGEAHRAPGLFSTGSIVSKLHKALKGSINGVENVYTQHQPLLSRTLEAIATGKLKDSAFPLVASSTSSRPSDVIVYMVGGVTFEEATKVAEFNAANPALRIILGGSCIHNSTSFLREISNAFGR